MVSLIFALLLIRHSKQILKKISHLLMVIKAQTRKSLNPLLVALSRRHPSTLTTKRSDGFSRLVFTGDREIPTSYR